MGPEEIHIYFWEGAPRPPKRKCDRPKNLEVFLVNFQNMWRFCLVWKGVDIFIFLVDLLPHMLSLGWAWAKAQSSIIVQFDDYFSDTETGQFKAIYGNLGHFSCNFGQ